MGVLSELRFNLLTKFSLMPPSELSDDLQDGASHDYDPLMVSVSGARKSTFCFKSRVLFEVGRLIRG